MPFLYFAIALGVLCALILARNHPKVKPLLAPIFRKRTIGGWILFAISTVILVSEKWDSINSFYEKLKKMGPVLKFVADVAHSPLVQLGVFIAGVVWIGLAAFFSVKREENKKNHRLQQPAPSFEPPTTPIIPAHDLSYLADPAYDHFWSKSTPQLKIACDPGIDGCVTPVQWGPNVEANYLRIKVESDNGESIKNCTGFLTRIERNGEKKWGGNNAQLTFAHGDDHDTFSKTIHGKMPEWLDVLAVSSEKEIRFATKGRVWRYPPSISEIFSEPGDYVLTVTVIGDGVDPVTAFLRFNWTQNWKTAALRLIPSKPAPPKAHPHMPTRLNDVSAVPPPPD